MFVPLAPGSVNVPEKYANVPWGARSNFAIAQSLPVWYPDVLYLRSFS